MTFEEIFERYWQKVFRLCMGYLNDAAWAKDVAQETFITVFQQLPKFRKEAAIGTWIFRIASNQCLRQIEKQQRMPKSELPFELADSVPVSFEKEVQFLYQSISELAEVDRIIISLELEDIKQAEIARIVGLSEANIRVKIHRIKKTLAQKFKQYESER